MGNIGEFAQPAQGDPFPGKESSLLCADVFLAGFFI
jgi:hypothetical protein